MKKRYIIAALIGALIGFFGLCFYDLAIKKQAYYENDSRTVMEVVTSEKCDEELAHQVKAGDRLPFKALVASLFIIQRLSGDGEFVLRVVLVSGLISTSALLAADKLMLHKGLVEKILEKQQSDSPSLSFSESDGEVISTSQTVPDFLK